jgi:para-aminobenzoate synthetase component I
VNNSPTPIAELSLDDWIAVGSGWTYLPYLARYSVSDLPKDWRRFLDGRFSAVLESGQTGNTTIAVPQAPSVKVFNLNGRVIKHTQSGAYESHQEKILAYVKAWKNKHRTPHFKGWPDFQGGLIGIISYEAVTQFEPVVSTASDINTPLAVFINASEACIYDKNKKELTVAILCPTNQNTETSWKAAQKRSHELAIKWISTCNDKTPEFSNNPNKNPTVLNYSLDEESFKNAAISVKNYISAGDTYQVNLSTRLEVPAINAPMAYEWLRQNNPSPYMGYLKFPEGELVCGSPELLVEVIDGQIRSRPIAGTRPRGGSAESDEKWAQELSENKKENAEHLMLVDLLRNDVGRVSVAGTVKVPEFMAVERYSHVMHLVSQVEGKILPTATPADVIRSLFPGGTITGAPKVRTMQIISELEPVARGFYTGSVGWIGASGNMCFNIIIRSLWATQGRCFIQAGAGVVADSDPQQEYQESIRKAQAPLIAATQAQL